MPIHEKSRSLQLQRAAAEEVAIAALGFIAADDDRLVRFLGITGLSPATLRDAAARDDLGAGVLEYVISDEPLLLAFAAAQKLEPRHVVSACAILSPPVDPDRPVRRSI